MNNDASDVFRPCFFSEMAFGLCTSIVIKEHHTQYQSHDDLLHLWINVAFNSFWHGDMKT